MNVTQNYNLTILKHIYIYIQLFFFVFFFSCKKENESTDSKSYSITLHSEFEISDTIVLQKFVGSNVISIDSQIVVNKKDIFFEGVFKEQAFHRLIFKRNKLEKVIALDNQPIELSLKGNIALPVFSTTKGQLNQDFDLLNQANTQYQNFADSLNQQYILYSNTNPSKLEDIKVEFQKAEKQFIDDIKTKIKNQKLSIVSVLALTQLKVDTDFEFIDSTATKLEDLKGTSTYIDAFLTDFANLKSTSVGQPAPDFQANTPDGKIIKLSDYKGKYILLDFWASWCGPCRRENPVVVQAYKTFKNKNFEILSVSLDEDNEKWKQAIKDDNLTWNHVSDLKGWDSDLAKLYGVESIPQSYLLDSKGKIIAKNLRGQELIDKLKEVL